MSSAHELGSADRYDMVRTTTGDSSCLTWVDLDAEPAV